MYNSVRGGGKAVVYTLRNNQKSIGKSIPAFGFKKSQEKIRKLKVSRLLPNLWDFPKKFHTLGYGFKNLYEIFRLAYGFVFFVIAISELLRSLSFRLEQIEWCTKRR
jgi:hypothetical protein